jgi:hypothetical protein
MSPDVLLAMSPVAHLALRSSDCQDVALRDRAKIRELERDQGLGVARCPYELHFGSGGPIELHNRAQVSSTEPMLRKVTI